MEALNLDAMLGSSERERSESWRYSRNAVRALAQQRFVAADRTATPSHASIQALDLPFTRGRRVVFVNGAYSAEYSDDSAFENAPNGANVEHEAPERFVLTLSAATAPLHLVYLSVPGDAAGFWRSHCTIRVEAGIDAQIVEQHIAQPGAEMFGRLQIDTVLAARSRLHLGCLSDLAESASLLRVAHCSVGESAHLAITQAHRGGHLQRIESSIDLAAERAGFDARGVFVLRGREHVDVHQQVRHNARDTRSDMLWRGVADQRARGILHGAITVAKGADGADAQLQTKNLLLSPHAEIDAQPVLEIYADEVKAAHGATVGQLDEQALFYLRSRGLNSTQARSLLIGAFCHEVYAHIADADLRERFNSLVTQGLPASTPVAQ